MKRTILHYPTMNINDPQWLRQMVLYWDEVGSIVPEKHIEDVLARNPDLNVLVENGMYRIFQPDEYVQNKTELEDEFLSTIDLEPENNPLQKIPRGFIDPSKLSRKVLWELLERGRVKLEGNWLRFDSRIGWIYMSLLAKYMANDDDKSITTPGTNISSYLDAAYSFKDKNAILPGVAFSIASVMPLPHRDVPIGDVINFKIKRQAELQKLRLIILEYQDVLKNVKEKSEVVDITDRFVLKLKIEVEEIDRLFSDAKMPITLGAIESILKIGTPTLLAGLATIGTIPVSLTIAGTVIAGGLSLRKYQLDVRNDQQHKLAANSYSYLYHAYKEGIINRP